MKNDMWKILGGLLYGAGVITGLVIKYTLAFILGVILGARNAMK